MTIPIYYPPSEVDRTFSQAAPTYDRHAFVQYEIGQRLLERVDHLSLSPITILDVGSGTGKLTRALQERFPNSTVMGLDLAKGMLKEARLSAPSPFYLCANMNHLPFQSQSIDLIFSNFTLQWANDLRVLLSEFKRVLSPKGMLFFTTLGPQTLHELRLSFAKIDHYSHVHPFVDLHDLGDLLLRYEFKDPVVDRDMITLSYKNVYDILRDLKGIGTKNFSSRKRKGCAPSSLLHDLQQAYENFKTPIGCYPLTYEVLYGHAWNDEMRKIKMQVE